MIEKVTVEDILKDNPNNKVLLAKILIQTIKTNGQVAENIKNIQENKDCITILRNELKDKIGWKVFTVGTVVIGALIIAFNLLNIIKGM